MISAVLKHSHFEPPAAVAVIDRAQSIAEILADLGAPDWFFTHGTVRLNGHLIERTYWRAVRLKPDATGVLELCVVQQGKNTIALVGSVALVALAAAISGGLLGPAAAGTIGTGLFGSSFAAGGIGATLAAAGVGLAGSLLLTALTAPPKAGSEAERSELAQAGIGQNAVAVLEPLPVILGIMRASPPQLIPAYTTLEGGDLYVHAIVGVQGRCAISDILINGTDSDSTEGVTVESSDGSPGAADPTIAYATVIEQRDGVKLSEFQTKFGSNATQLEDQENPENSDISWHTFTTDGIADEVRIRLLWPSGIADITNGRAGFMPLRIEVREKGTSTWKKLPTMYFWDEKKGFGPLRQEVKLQWRRIHDGPHFQPSTTGVFPVYSTLTRNSMGKSFEYQAESHFLSASVGDDIPVMTAATTSGATMSASTELGAGNEAWKAADSSTTTYWSPSNNSLPAWIKIDFGAGNEKTVKCMRALFDSGATGNTAKTGYLEGSNDNSTWTLLSTLDDPNAVADGRYVQGLWVENPASYRYYRFTITANAGASNDQIRLMDWRLISGGDMSCADYPSGDPIQTVNKTLYTSVTRDGVTIFLDPATFTPGQYEIRMERGWAGAKTLLTATDTFGDPIYNGSANNASFFNYSTSADVKTIYQSQKDFRSDCQVETFATVSDDEPIDLDGIAWIAIRGRNINIDSVSALFSSKARTVSGSVWTDAESETANPAALYRHHLIGGGNPDPLPGEIVDEEVLKSWYADCASAGYACNAIVSGRSVAEVLQLIASAGYASPKASNLWGIVQDGDTSGDPITQMLTPLNAKDLGTTIAITRLPHAIRAEFLDATDDYQVTHEIVYRDGYSAVNASLIETISYEGLTALAAVQARAAFDLKQGKFRNRSYVREVGLEGYSISRGALIGLTDDVLDRAQAYGLIKSIGTSGGNYVSITLDNIVPLSAGSGDAAVVGDITGLSDITDTDQPMGVGIRLADGTVLTKQIDEVTDGATCTFTTPFTDDDSLAVGQLVAVGVHGRVYRRVRCIAVEPSGHETRRLTFVDEAAAELFA